MNADENALKIFNQIVHGRESERSAACELLDERKLPVNRRLLRELLLEAIQGDFAPGREDWEQDDSLKWTRSWLVNTLGKVCDDDPVAAAAVRRHLDPTYEKAYWARYWAFEGLLSTGAPDLLALAKLLAKEQEPLLRMVAHCVLATRGDAQEREGARQQVQEALDSNEPGLQWASLRALRLVPIPSMFGRMRAIVESGQNDDITYDAIVALSVATPGSLHAHDAALTLSQFITKRRLEPWFDGMRTKALRSLGKLKVESVAPLLVEELADDNPAVARAAALALKEVVDIRTAAARVVEAASKASPERADALARALRWMERDAVVEELESVMLSGRPEHQEAARLLMSEMGGLAAMQKLRARTASVAQYGAEMEKAEEKIRNLFESTISEARKGFVIAALMDVAVFVVGLGLVVTSAVLVFNRNGDLSNWAGIGLTGGSGVVGVLHGLFFAKPRKQIVEAVDHLMHLKVVFLAYLRQLHQVDQAYTRRLLEDKSLGSDEAGQYSTMVEATMSNAVARLLAMKEHRQSAPTATAEPVAPRPPEAAAGNGNVAIAERAAVA